jgi:recombination protein RecR
MDVVAFEQTSQFSGLYFVLHGVLSPIDGITAHHLGLNELVEYVANNQFEEVIIATYATAEGEATAHYIAELLKQQPTRCTRLAYGIPHGGEFEYLNATTLSQALSGRSTI